MIEFFFKKESAALFWFPFKLILFYLAISYFFITYTGLTTEGGRLYSSFLVQHFDFISWFRRFLLWGGSLFASSIGYPSGYNDYFLYVRNGSAVRMVYSCLGFSLMSAYAALVLAWPAKVLYRLMSLVIGTIIIIVLNMIRLGGLAVLYTTRNYVFFKNINHHDLFNIIVLMTVFVMFVIHVKYSESKYTRKID